MREDSYVGRSSGRTGMRILESAVYSLMVCVSILTGSSRARKVMEEIFDGV